MSYRISTLANGNKLHVWQYNVKVGSVTIDQTEGSSVWFWQWTYPNGSVMGSADSLEAAQSQAEAALNRYVALSNS